MKYFTLVLALVLSSAVFAENIAKGPDRQAIVAEAQSYSNRNHIRTNVWKLRKEEGQPQRWLALTINQRDPTGATLDQVVQPK